VRFADGFVDFGMDLALLMASSTNHHLFSSLDSQPQIGWLSIFAARFFQRLIFEFWSL
jgi:hypothetical protein